MVVGRCGRGGGDGIVGGASGFGGSGSGGGFGFGGGWVEPPVGVEGAGIGAPEGFAVVYGGGAEEDGGVGGDGMAQERLGLGGFAHCALGGLAGVACFSEYYKIIFLFLF